MAIDKNKTQDLIKNINDLFDHIPGDKKIKEFIQSAVMGEAFDEIKSLIEDSRPPVLLLVGRSGHGKSSLINALSNKRILDTTDPVEPNTGVAERHYITFEERYSAWEVIDTRGIFEATKPSSADNIDAESALSNAIAQYKPDVLMHIISAKEVRNMGPDLEYFSRLSKEIREKNNGLMLPTIICINQVDVLDPPTKWPPEQFPRKAGNIIDLMDYLSIKILKVPTINLDKSNKLKGYRVEFSNEHPYLGIIPICCYWDNDDDLRWNIDSLAQFIGDTLPKEAMLDFFQGQNRRELLKKLSSSLINRFSTIAGGIGLTPIPFADIALLIPLQMLMISIIGGLSCRDFSFDTAKEYLGAAGVNLATGFGAKQIARQLIKLIPGAGEIISGGVASATTYGIGKAAETYFFHGKIEEPASFHQE